VETRRRRGVPRPSRGHLGLQSLILGLTQLTVGVVMNAVFVITAGSVAVSLAPPLLIDVQ
jgi:hypothetical protein